MPLYVSMHNNANLSNADVNATGFKNPYENYLTEQQAYLDSVTKLANEQSNQAPYNQYIQYMSALTKDPNNSTIWKDATSFLNRYEHNPQGFMQEYPYKFTGKNLYKPGNSNVITNTDTNTTGTNDATSKPVASSLWDPAFNGVLKNGSAEDRAKIAGMENTLENYKILNKMYEDTKPGFFGNIWNKITEEPGGFIGGALNIWNSIRANDLAKDYSSMMRDSFNLQKQQYLDREDRAKQEFAALQSRRAGSSL
jgi:hypothetical protein